MKMSELIAIRPSIEKMAGQQHSFPAALKFAKFTRKIIMILQDFDVKRAELFNKYGVTQGENNTIVIPPDNETKFKAEMQIELDKEVKIDPLDVSALGDMKVAPADLINCLQLFE